MSDTGREKTLSLQPRSSLPGPFALHADTGTLTEATGRDDSRLARIFEIAEASSTLYIAGTASGASLHFVHCMNTSIDKRAAKSLADA